ncbi:MAG: hypothetical protein ACLTTU_13635 [Bilophila wadsworthia]
MARSDNEEISSSVSQYIYKWRQIKVDINGDDLHRLGLEPGPQFGSVMRMVLAAKLDGKAETREAQLKLAEELIRKGFPGNGTAGAAPKKPVLTSPQAGRACRAPCRVEEENDFH